MHEPALHADPIAWLQAHALRPQAPPARWRVLQGLAQRAAAQQGALRCLLLDKLLARLAALDAGPLTRPPRSSIPKSGLACLTEALAQGRSAGDEPEAPEMPLRALQAQPRSWTGLRMAQRMAAVQAVVNAASIAAPQALGPLNAYALVPRALERLHALSPAYLQQLLAHADALAALGTGSSHPDTPPTKASAPASKPAVTAKRPARGRTVRLAR